jgi:hypothetical protein
MSLHSCANCRWFVASSRSVRCLKPGTPHVMDAGGANQCATFEFVETDSAVVERQTAARAVGGGTNQTPAGARERWDRLFGP